MESMTGLCFSTLPNQSICIPCGFHDARATHSSLSLGHNSSTSLPKSSCRGHALDHVAYTRDNKREANVPRASPFFSSNSWSRRTIPRLNAVLNDEQHRNQVMEVAKELKASKHFDIAAKLLVIHVPKLTEDPVAAYKLKMEAMQLLSLQGDFKEARVYYEDIEKNIPSYREQFDKDSELFYNMKYVILCGLGEHEAANQLRENRKAPAPPKGETKAPNQGG